jgi:hypothetical protein
VNGLINQSVLADFFTDRSQVRSNHTVLNLWKKKIRLRAGPDGWPISKPARQLRVFKMVISSDAGNLYLFDYTNTADSESMLEKLIFHDMVYLLRYIYVYIFLSSVSFIYLLV